MKWTERFCPESGPQGAFVCYERRGHPGPHRWHPHNDELLNIWEKQPGDELAQIEIESGVYERDYTPKPGDYCIDVGAHVGFFTRRLAALVGAEGRVIALEPEPRNVLLLTTMTPEDTVTVIPYAAWHRNTTLPLYMSPNTVCHSTIVNWRSSTISVHATTVDFVVAAMRWQRLDLLKIDAESAERHVLLGARRSLRQFRPHLVVEVQPHNAAAVRRIGRQLGYRFTEDALWYGKPM